MKNCIKLLGIIALVAITGFTMAACDNGGGSSNSKDTAQVYQGEDVQGNKYVLTIAESTGRSARAVTGDSYELTVTFKDGTKITSKGTIKEVTPDGTFKLEPSVEGSSTFSLVINNKQINSVTGEIVLPEGKIFTPPTFRTIHLRASRWGDRDNESRWGEHWSSGFCINLFDFIEGNIKPGAKYSITLSGTVDTALENTLIDVWYVPSGITSGWDSSNEWIGGETDVDHYIKISRGQFKQTYLVQLYAANLDKYVFLELMDRKLIVDVEKDVFFDAGGIPADIPNDTIMATIRNFTISIKETK